MRKKRLTDVLGPTDRQVDVLRAIHRHQVRLGYAISIRELGDELGIASTNGVNDHLLLLERKGLVTRKRQLCRTLQLTRTGLREVL